MAVNTFGGYNDIETREKDGEELADEKDRVLDALRNTTNRSWDAIAVILEQYGVKLTPDLENAITPNFDAYEGDDITDVLDAFEEATEFNKKLIKALEKNLHILKMVTTLKEYVSK